MKKTLMRSLSVLALSSLLFVQMATAVETQTEDPYTDDQTKAVTLEGFLNNEGKVDLSWTQYQGGDLKWYKVVHSQTNPDAYYPVDGYIGVYTDPSITQHTHVPKAGTNYYRVCVITYDNLRGCSNTVTIEAEGDTTKEVTITTEDPYTDDPSIEVTLSGSLNDLGKAELEWTMYDGGDLKWYKVVHSQTNAYAYYPADGYIGVYSDPTVTAHTHTEVPKGTNYYRVCVITDDDRRGCSNTVTLNKETATDSTYGDTYDHWAKNYIEDLTTKEAVEGYEDGNFYPDKPIIRAEAVKIMMKGLGHDEIGCDASLFMDLETGDWFCGIVTKAYKIGAIKGIKGYLEPERKMNRAEAVKVLMEAKGIEPPVLDTNPFPDVPYNEWYAGYVYKASKLGYIEGIDGKFEPAKEITRGELSKIVSLASGK